MGEGDYVKANHYFKLVALFNFFLGCAISFVVYRYREGLALVYTSAVELVPMIMEGYTVMLFVFMIHGVAMVQAGAVRGLGMLDLGTWVAFIAFYMVCLPFAYMFAFNLQMGMVGLWWGVVAGAVSEIFIYVIFLRWLCDWKHLAFQISENMKNLSVSLRISFKLEDSVNEQLMGRNKSQ